MHHGPRWSLAVAALCATGCGAHGGASGVNGDWKIINAVVSGSPVPPTVFHDGVLHLHNGAYAFQTDSGTYTVVSGTPAAMDIHGVHGPNAGKNIPAIFKRNGDTLIICYDLAGTTRPAAFTSDSGTTNFLARYVRAR